MRIAVITESENIYNLGARRIEAAMRAAGHEVIYSYRANLDSLKADKAYLSAIFTWDLPQTLRDANLLKAHGVEVEIGGPAATVMADMVWNYTRIHPHIGIDPRFENVKGDFEMTFTQRGCPRGCSFCLVEKVEGKKIIEYDDFNIPVGKNPKVGDNNLLCTSWRHQQIVVEKLKGVKNLDINSGFDDRIFMQDPLKYFKLYSQLKMEAWRFAFDEMTQREPLKACVEFLHAQGVGYRKITVFCLVGGLDQTFEQCREKLQFLVDIGSSPYPQRYRPFHTTYRNTTPVGWQDGQLDLLFGYYGVPYIWKSCSWDEWVYSQLHGRKLPVAPEQMQMFEE